jgi:hypothetical protein
MFSIANATDYHNCITQTHVISQFLWVKSPGTAYLSPLQGYKQDVEQNLVPSGSSTGEESTSKLTHIFGKIHFLVTVEFKAAFIHFFRASKECKISRQADFLSWSAIQMDFY